MYMTLKSCTNNISFWKCNPHSSLHDATGDKSLLNTLVTGNRGGGEMERGFCLLEKVTLSPRGAVLFRERIRPA